MKHNVECWKKYTSPTYDTVVHLEHYHLVKDKNSANFYLEDNKVNSLMDRKQHNIRGFGRQGNRKQIDTFVRCSDSRFEPIQKSPKNMTNVKKINTMNF